MKPNPTREEVLDEWMNRPPRAREANPAEAELRDLRKIGDILQSAADRLADHVERGDKPPYEVAMACHEARDMVAAWTEVRKSAWSG